MNEKSILDRLPYMVWTYDASGILDFVNAAWTQYTGLGLAASRSSGWTSLVPLNEGTAFAASLKNAMATGVQFRCNAGLKHHRASGDFRRHTLSIKPYSKKKGAIVSWIGTGWS